MPENKIADGLPNASEILGDRTPARAYTADGKFWLVSQKFANQPSISYAHDTPLQGGHVVCFDVHTKTWSAPVQFDAISQEELMEGLVLGYKNSLLLLAYRAEPFSYESLYEWKDGRWHKFEQFRVDGELKGSKGCLHTSLVVPDGEAYLVHDSHNYAAVGKLNVQNGTASIEKVVVCDNVYPDHAPTSPHFVCTAVLDGKLHVFFGQQMCGFRWQKSKLLTVDLKDGKSQMKEVASEVQGESSMPNPPPWSFSGPRDCFLYPSMRRWMFLGGTCAQGMSHTKRDDSIWHFDLNGHFWMPHNGIKVPDGASLFGVTGGDHSGKPPMVYMVNPTTGVYEIDPQCA